jgi:hypothetical protein
MVMQGIHEESTIFRVDPAIAIHVAARARWGLPVDSTALARRAGVRYDELLHYPANHDPAKERML